MTDLGSADKCTASSTVRTIGCLDRRNPFLGNRLGPPKVGGGEQRNLRGEFETYILIAACSAYLILQTQACKLLSGCRASVF